MFNREEPYRSIRLKSPIIPIIVFILFGVQLFFPNKGWMILLSGFGGMWLISFIWARTLKGGLRINRDMSFGWKQVGDRLRERVLLENNSWIPGLWVHVDDHSDMRDYEISSITDVQGWRYRNWHTQGICYQRGLFTLGPVTLKSEDPFGIYQVSVDYRESVNMMVVPPVVSLPEIDIASGGRVGEGRSSNKGLKQTVSTIGVREYVPGDSLRWMHWPTIARTGKLFVHLFDNEPTSDWWVLLDMDESVQVGSGPRSTEEHGVMLAASLVNRGIQMGKHVGLITHGNQLIWHKPELGDAHLWSVLRSLATIRPGGPPLDQILNKLKSSLGRNSSLIIITPNITPGWTSALDLLKRLGIIPTVLLLDPVSFDGEGNIEGIRSRLRKMGVTHHILSADLLDRPQKQAKKEWEWLTSTGPSGEIMDPWDIRWQSIKRGLRTWGIIIIFYYVFAKLLGGAVRGLEVGLVGFLIGAGLIFGGWLAASKLRGFLFGALSTITGVVFSILRVGNLGNLVLDAIVRIFRLLPAIFSYAYRSAEMPDFQPLIQRLIEIGSGGSALAMRLWDWGINLVRGQSYYDPVAITFLWGFAVWGTVVWSTWGIFRKNNPLTGFIPAITLVGVTMAFVGKTVYDIVFMLGATMALMVLIPHDVREHFWMTNRLTYTAGIRKNIFIASATITICLMVFSLITPSISIDKITQFVRNITGEQAAEEATVARSLGLERQGQGVERDILDTIRAGGLPNEHLIGSGSELSEQVVMVARIESPQAAVLESPLYLRSLVYDNYTGRGWESRGTAIVTYNPGEELMINKPINSFPVRQEIQFVEDLGGFIYTLGNFNSADQEFKVAWRIQDHQNGIYDTLGATVETKTYRADSYTQMHSMDELRSAGQSYPDWIRERYLNLPSSVPESVLALAVELTATGATPYDRAVSIEQYLRKIPYSLSVSTGPAGSDIVEYFLFRLQKGYCDYYASAMVVLSRAAGIPARYVVGYIGEYFDEAEGVYIITADEAHAWAEVFFPGYGWVPFEPTGGRSAIERSLEPFPELPDDFELDLSPLVPKNKFALRDWSWLLWLTPILLVAFAGVGFRISDWFLARIPVDILIPRLYKRIYRYARWAGFPVKNRDTAFVFSDAFTRYLTQLGKDSYWAKWLLEGVWMIREMTEVFVQCLFSPQKPDMNSTKILQLYQQLRPRLWVLCLFGKAYSYSVLRPFIWENLPLLIPLHKEEE